jgi:CubicO group peptidase (beta-lactamase class C family)
MLAVRGEHVMHEAHLQAECCDGFGFSVFGSGDLGWYGHTGGSPGMNASFKVYPALGYTVIVLSNLDPPSADDLSRRYFETTIVPQLPRRTDR